METDDMKAEQEAAALRKAKKSERRAAMAELRRLHAIDPEKAREAARRWFAENAEQAGAAEAEISSFHLRKLSEADPQRASKAADALRKSEADAGRAQNDSRETVKQWRKRNPNKVKKLNKLHRESRKSK